MKYSINQPVWEININNPKEYDKWSVRKKGVFIEKHKIIGISPYKICIDDDWFHTFYRDDIEGRKKSSHNNYLDDISVTIRTNDSILGDGVFITLHSTKEPDKKLLKKMVDKAHKEIDKNYGFLFSGAKEEIKQLIDQYNDKN